jgi:thioredoxin-related protein
MISHYSKRFFYQLFLFLSILLSSCSSDKSNETKVVLKDEFIQKAELKNQEMETLLHAACLYCHKTQDVPGEKELAPKMQVVIDLYKAQYPNREDFVKAVTEFTVNPQANKTLMQSAIDTYKLMPNSGIVKQDAEDIANYLFDYKFQ